MRRIVINERQFVTTGLFAFAVLLLAMAWDSPPLWEVEVFKVVLQAVVLTGLLNMVAAFHFASNKGSEQSRENTGKAFDAITAAATGQPAHTGPTGTAEDPLKAEIVNTPDDPANVKEAKEE